MVPKFSLDRENVVRKRRSRMTTLKGNIGDWVSDHIGHTPDNFAERCIVCPLSRGEYYFALFHFSLLTSSSSLVNPWIDLTVS